VVGVGRTVEVARAQFAKVRLKRVHDARHDRRDLLDHLLLGQFEHNLDPEILRALGARIGEIDEDFRQVDEHRGLDVRGLRLGLVRVGKKEKIGADARANQHQRGRADDEKFLGRQLELEFRLGLFGLAFSALFDFGLAVECGCVRVCHEWKPRSL